MSAATKYDQAKNFFHQTTPAFYGSVASKRAKQLLLRQTPTSFAQIDPQAVGDCEQELSQMINQIEVAQAKLAGIQNTMRSLLSAAKDSERQVLGHRQELRQMREEPQEGALFEVYTTLRARSQVMEQKRLEQELKYFATYIKPLEDFLHVYYQRFVKTPNHRPS